MKPCRQCGWPYDVDASGLCPSCVKLKGHPDALSKRTKFGRVPFVDLKQVDESERLDQIVSHLRANPGKNVLVLVDSGPGHEDKGDRYIRGIRERLPTVTIQSRRPGPVANGEAIIFQQPQESPPSP